MLRSVLADIARRVFGHAEHAGDAAAADREGAAAHGATVANAGTCSALEGASPQALLRAGIAAAQAGKHLEARSLLGRAARATPRNADALEALANVEQLLGRFDAAQSLYRQALCVDASVASRWANLGLCLRALGRLGEATDAFERSLGIDAVQPETRLGLALVAIDQGAVGDGERQLRALLAEWPQCAEAHAALAHVLLLQERFREGWQAYEWRLRLPEAARRSPLPIPLWDGTPIEDGTLLIGAEQGLGDQIMFLSCVPAAAARAGRCWLECDARLAPIARRSFPSVRVLPYRRARDADWLERVGRPDVQIPLGSLPRLFRGAAEEFPRHAGYLRADPARVAAWRARLAALGTGPKIGLSWRGGAPTTRGVLRSVALAALQPVAAALPCVLVSLQYGECGAEIAAAPQRLGQPLWHFPEAIADYDETAALVAALDRVITVQTAVAHLAGALGKRVWIMLPVAPEWRYGACGERMCWYPSARLFRQQRFGEWDAVIRAVAGALREDAGA